MVTQNKYSALKSESYTLEGYTLIPIREEDIIPIKNWRNQQVEMLRQRRQITDKEQFQYYEKVLKPTFDFIRPSKIIFSFLKGDQLIGYGGITNIEWESKRGEVTFLLEPHKKKEEELYKKEFSIFLQLIKKVAFEELNFNRLYTETHDVRPVHIKTLEENGFKYEGRMIEHVYIRDKYVDSVIHGFNQKDYK